MASLASLLTRESASDIYARGLAIAQALGLQVANWSPKDPTRSLYKFAGEVLGLLEGFVPDFIGSGFLDTARGDWLTLLAEQLFGVERVEATRASTMVRLTNGGGGFYEIEPGDVVLKNTSTGATYTNTSGGTLTPGGTLDVEVLADEAGAASSAAATKIDALVTTLLGVTCSNATAALGLDQEDDESLRDRCRTKLGTLSPNGPRDAYVYVVRSAELTGTTAITRARSVGDSTTGHVEIYVAGPSGAVTSDDVAAAQAAVEKFAAPVGFTPTVHNTSNVTVNFEFEAWLYDTVGESEATILANMEAALDAMLARRPIGGDVIASASSGALYRSLIAATIKGVYPDHCFRVEVGTPEGDTDLAINEVAVKGYVTGAIHLETP